MMDPTPHAPAALPSAHTPGDCLAGGGEMGALMRTMDWAATSLGPVEQWPQSLRSAVSICLGSRFPILIWWGPQLVMLYNDAYRPMLGATKHPQALGQAGRSCWPEIWHIIGPMLEQTVMTEGQATWSNDQLLVLDRNNYREECYFTFSYSPIRDESGGVGGVFCAVTETTARVVGERRLRTLRELAAHAGDAKSAAEAGEMAVQTLANNQADLPFVLLYLLDDDGQTATLVGASGLTPGTPASPLRVELPTAAAAGPGWPWAEVIQDGQPLLISDLLARFGPLPGGSWPAPPKQALILPITAATAAQPIGLLVAGISPRRGWDDDYGGFCDLVAGHVATAIANARAYEAERRRAEALAELDRAKSTFFSNVSHEFRTPLTLMLGPLEEILNREEPMLTVADRAQVAMAHRNGLRLLKLVNNLLDFSRIEAGRMQANYTTIDLAAYTGELASVFRSAIEQAGLQLHIDCPSPQFVSVDAEMWEKIVLNLLSNAFKFTFQGEIAVSLHRRGEQVELRVRDTGIGIAEAEIPNLFTRFHRVRGVQARTYEGSGIGLALAQELVRLHGGSIQVDSTVTAGTTFIVTIPAAVGQLAAESSDVPHPRAALAQRTGPYLEETLRRLPSAGFQSSLLDFSPDEVSAADARDEARIAGAPAGSGSLGAQSQQPKGASILLADDNADLRVYLTRLLAPHYSVIPVADGQAALQAAQTQKPDLVLADIMMPVLGGIELLRALRADPQTKTLPVILLSARAGEEARIEGLEIGADDYLVKPFTARELLARVRAHLQMAAARQSAAERERALRSEIQMAKALLEKVLAGVKDHLVLYDRNWRYLYLNDAAAKMLGMPKAELLGQCIWELFPNAVGNPYYQAVHQALAEQRNLVLEHHYPPWDRWLENHIYALPDGVAVFATDITARKQTENQLREMDRRLRLTLSAARMVAWEWDTTLNQIITSEGFAEIYGIPAIRMAEDGFQLLHPADRDRHTAVVQRVAEQGGSYQSQFRIIRPDNGHTVWLEEWGFAEVDASGQVQRLVGVVMDISKRKASEEALQRNAEFHRIIADLSTDYAWTARVEPGGEVVIEEVTAGFTGLFGYTLEELVAAGGWQMIVHPEDRAALAEQFAALLRGHKIEGEIRHIAKNGCVRLLHFLTHPLLDRSGKVIRLYGAVHDITKQKAAEEALRTSEARLQQLADAMPQLVWIADNNGMVTYYNRRASEFAGLTQTASGSWLWQPMLHEDDQQTTFQAWQEAVANQQPYTKEHRLRMADGAYRWHLSRAYPVVATAGHVTTWFGTATDIHDLKLAEDALRSSEERFSKAFHAGPQPMCITRFVDGGYVDVNESFARLLGYSRAEILGRTSLETGLWSDPETRRAANELLRAQGGHRTYEHRFRNRHGEWRELQAAAELIELDGQLCILNVAMDITTRKQIEQALRESEERFRTLADSAPVLIWVNGLEGLEFVNRQFLEFMGRTMNEVRGMAWVSSIHPGDRESYLREYATAFAGRQPFASRLRLRAADGAYCWFQSMAGPRFTPEGEFLGYVGSSVDISEIVRAEEMLRELNATLEQRVNQRTAELERSNYELDQFAYVASHDLRAPLRDIELLAGFISEDAGELLPAPSQRHLALLRRRIKRLDTLLLDLLSYSRAARQRHRMEEVDLAVLLQDLIDLLNPPPGFQIVLTEPWPTLLTERTPLATILRNLISNAIRHHDQPSNGRVTLTLEDKGEVVEFAVADNGPGIELIFHTRIFEMFQTLKPRDQVEGSGLGLALVKRLVESRNGTIWVESAPGHGATFRFTWPKG